MSEPLPQCPHHPQYYLAPGGECPQCAWTPSISVDRDALRGLYEAVDDLWGVIEAEQMLALQPETIDIAKGIHQILWHRDHAVEE